MLFNVKNCRDKKSGQGIIELIVGILMFTLLIALVVNVSTYLYVQHTMVTAAREGARVAALNEEIGDPDSASAGVEAVRDHITGMVVDTTGISLDEENITITPPNPADPIGERSVSVEIDMTFEHVLPASEFAAALSQASATGGSSLLHAEASMHYEE